MGIHVKSLFQQIYFCEQLENKSYYTTSFIIGWAFSSMFVVTVAVGDWRNYKRPDQDQT